MPFASQPSSLGLIQGPIVLSGGTSPFVPPLIDPIMLPYESSESNLSCVYIETLFFHLFTERAVFAVSITDPDDFNVPPGITIDISMYFVSEEKQIDTVILNNLDVRGDMPSVGTLSLDNFVGMTMADQVFVFGNGPYSGVAYDGCEVLLFNLGDGVDHITVEDTSEAISVMNMAGSNDTVTVKSLSGPLLVNGEDGTDNVVVSSDELKVDGIDALLAFDGGESDEQDFLLFENSGDWRGLDDVVNVTRLIVEVYSMEAPDLDPTDNETNPILPRDSYIITLRNATGGSFTLSLDDPSTNRTNLISKTIEYPTTATIVKDRINSLLYPDIIIDSMPISGHETCGKHSNSACSSSVLVWQMGSSEESQTFLIFFAGQRLNAGITLSFNTDGLNDFYTEKFNNNTNDAIFVNSDIAYTNVDILHIYMGEMDTVVNLRGTSAETTIFTQEGNDKFFLSNDANEDTSTAATQDILYGVLDYIEKDLHLVSQDGRHRLLMSDENSTKARGVGSRGYAELTESSLINIADEIAHVYFESDGFDDVILWLGAGSDFFVTNSIPRSTGTRRTTTTVHSGEGDDTLLINLDASQNEGSVFVANGQAGQDTLDASISTFSVILFGDGVRCCLLCSRSLIISMSLIICCILTNPNSQGDDTIIGGSGKYSFLLCHEYCIIIPPLLLTTHMQIQAKMF